MKKTYYFNTGVKYSNYPYLSEGQVLRGGTKQIPFECEDVPDTATFAFACDKNDLLGNYIIAPIVGGSLLSKFAYFNK